MHPSLDLVAFLWRSDAQPNEDRGRHVFDCNAEKYMIFSVGRVNGARSERRSENPPLSVSKTHVDAKACSEIACEPSALASVRHPSAKNRNAYPPNLRNVSESISIPIAS